MNLQLIAVEAAYTANGHVLELLERARQGSELARRSLITWERWAAQHRELRIRGLFAA